MQSATNWRSLLRHTWRRIRSKAFRECAFERGEFVGGETWQRPRPTNTGPQCQPANLESTAPTPSDIRRHLQWRKSPMYAHAALRNILKCSSLAMKAPPLALL